MSWNAQQPVSSPGMFGGAALDWTADEFACWLLRGFSTWHDVPSRNGRERGFRPAVFDPDRPALLQVEDHVGLLAADMKAAFRQGILIAIANWTTHLPQIVLRELLWLAAAYRPVGVAPLLYQLFVDGRLGAHNEGEDTRQRAFRTLCAFPTPEARRLLVTMRESRYWRRDLAAAFLRAQAAAGSGWIEWCRDVGADLQSLRRDDAVDLGVTFRLLVQDVGGLAPFMRSLPVLRPVEDAWIIDSLVKGDEPVLRFQLVRTDWIVECGDEKLAASKVFAGRDVKVFDLWVKAVLKKAAAPVLSALPATYVRQGLHDRVVSFLHDFTRHDFTRVEFVMRGAT